MSNNLAKSANSMDLKPASSGTAISSAMQSRESSQVEVAMIAAKRFPRDEKQALDRILNACSRPGLAEQALYDFSRGGTQITGTTIKLAAAIAGCWGNLECGWREIDRYKDVDGVGVSVIEVAAWDLESNNRCPRIFNSRHWRDTKGGGYKLTDERDIYENNANLASRRLRSCIEQVIPGDIFEEAKKQCYVTLKASADTGPETQKKIVEVFAEYKITKAQIEARIQRRIDAITPAQVVNLRKIENSLKEGMSVPADWFPPAPETPKDPVDPFAGEENKQPAEEGQKAPAKKTASKEGDLL